MCQKELARVQEANSMGRARHPLKTVGSELSRTAAWPAGGDLRFTPIDTDLCT
jgi:hypothetical protein